MKLVLKSYIASKYPEDPILDFLDSRGFHLIPYAMGSRYLIRTSSGNAATLKLVYAKENHHILLETEYFESLLINNLYALLQELAGEVSAGDLSKLPELADTYIAFENLSEKRV